MNQEEPPMAAEATGPVETLQGLNLPSKGMKRSLIDWGDGVTKIQAHKAKVWNVEVSRDLQLMGSGGQDGDDRTDTVKLWDLKSGQLLHTMEGHERAVVALSFSADGSTVASGSDDSTIRLWSTTSGELTKTITSHTDFIRDVRYSPKGDLIASASWDTTARIHRADGELVRTLWGHQGWCWHSSWSPDQTKLSSTARDHCLRIWDVETGQCIKDVHTGHTGSVFEGRFSPDGNLIVTASGDAKVKIWDARSYECIRTMEGHTGWTWRAEWSSDGAMIVTASMDRTVRFWDVAEGRCVYKLDEDFGDAVSGAHFVGPQGTPSQLITSCLDGYIRLHELSGH